MHYCLTIQYILMHIATVGMFKLSCSATVGRRFIMTRLHREVVLLKLLRHVVHRNAFHLLLLIFCFVLLQFAMLEFVLSTRSEWF